MSAPATPASAAPNTTSVTIAPTQPWTDTGLSVTAGQGFTITASGTIRFVDGRHYAATPSGRTPCLEARKGPEFATALPCYSLMGKIGVDGIPFEVGTSYSSAATVTSGELYLGPNDNRYPDNRGTWTAVVTGATPTPATFLSNNSAPAPSATVPPAPSRTVSPSKVGPNAHLAFTGVGPALQALGIVGVILALVGLALYFFGADLRRVMLWLLGM